MIYKQPIPYGTERFHIFFSTHAYATVPVHSARAHMSRNRSLPPTESFEARRVRNDRAQNHCKPPTWRRMRPSARRQPQQHAEARASHAKTTHSMIHTHSQSTPLDRHMDSTSPRSATSRERHAREGGRGESALWLRSHKTPM